MQVPVAAQLAPIAYRLFRCATLPSDEGLRLWRTLRKEMAREGFTNREKRLLPAVWKNLEQFDHPEADLEMFRTSIAKSSVRNERLERVCKETVMLLQSNGIEVIVLKGMVLNRLIHGNLWVRPIHDFDLLVKPEQAKRAIEILRDADWEPIGKVEDPVLRLENATEFKKAEAKLDLHWCLLREARRPGQDDVLWNRRVPFELLGYETWRLSLDHLLFQLLAVANREPHHLARYLYDIEIFVRQCQDRVELSEVFRLLEARHLLQRVHSLPLKECGWPRLTPSRRATVLDRVWSAVSGHRHDKIGEWYYGAFPILDYWLNYRGTALPGWGFSDYLISKLELKGLGDLFSRAVAKVRRLVGLTS